MSGGSFLTPKEQIKHCEAKGIQFNKISKTKATVYLEDNNNYFKLRSFRKNFVKNDATKKYLHLDFAHLIDLAIIDNRLRRILLEMALSIEHFSKVHLLKILRELDEDGYVILQDYLNQLDESKRKRVLSDLKKNSGSTYCGNLYDKYMKTDNLSGCPVWVFLEVISFGQYLHFYKFCTTRSPDIKVQKELTTILHLMRTVKDLRNACAHNNCIINDLRAKHSKSKFRPNQDIMRALSTIGISKDARDRHLKRAPFYQIVTTLYAHTIIVQSKGVHRHISEELQEFKNRIYRDFSYNENEIIKAPFNLLIKIFDSWFNLGYDTTTEKKQLCFCKSGIVWYRSIFSFIHNLVNKIKR